MLRSIRSINLRALCVLVLSALVFCTCCISVLAAPDTDLDQPHNPSTKWVDLQAHVPADFKGSVSVLLQQDATGELYTLTSYPINDYLNSIQLPIGKYTVMQAFTSEDAFLYDAFIATESFDLQSTLQLEVTVTPNPEGTTYLNALQAEADSSKVPPETSSVTESEPETPAVEPNDISSSSEESVTSESDAPTLDSSVSEPDDAAESDNSLESEVSSGKEEQESVLAAFFRTAFGFICAVAILAILFFGAFILYHRFND